MPSRIILRTSYGSYLMYLMFKHCTNKILGGTNMVLQNRLPVHVIPGQCILGKKMSQDCKTVNVTPRTKLTWYSTTTNLNSSPDRT